MIKKTIPKPTREIFETVTLFGVVRLQLLDRFIHQFDVSLGWQLQAY
jgi:hypothetical protein